MATTNEPLIYDYLRSVAGEKMSPEDATYMVNLFKEYLADNHQGDLSEIEELDFSQEAVESTGGVHPQMFLHWVSFNNFIAQVIKAIR